MMHLTARHFDAEGFRPFGTLVDTKGLPGLAVNEGRGRRIGLPAALQHDAAAAMPALALYEIEASQWPVHLRVMERHRHSEQLFMFLTGKTFLVVVAHSGADGFPDIRTAQAFTGGSGQGVIYGRGIWHLPMVALQQPGQFAMMMWETDTEGDCDTHFLAPGMHVQPASL